MVVVNVVDQLLEQVTTVVDLKESVVSLRVNACNLLPSTVFIIVVVVVVVL